MKKTAVYRKKPFVRGVGEGVWHDTEGWGLSEATQRQDRFNYDELLINSVRSWGFFPTDKDMQAYFERTGNTMIGTMGHAQAAPGPSAFADGTPAGQNFFEPDLAEKVYNILAYLADFKQLDGMECILMGNEQSYLGQNADGDYMLAGFDEDTQKAFKTQWLPDRFGTVKKLNEQCGLACKGFGDVFALENDRIKLEYWLFLRAGFEKIMEYSVNRLRSENPGLKFGYAKFMGRRNPSADDAYMRFMDYGTQNLYWQWYRDSNRFMVKLDELCGSSWEKPVYLTEYGMQNMYHMDGQKMAARRYKQTLTGIFMRPQSQGVQLFCYAGQYDAHTLEDPEWSWGLTWPNREKKLSFYAIKQLFHHFHQLEERFAGDMHNTPLVAMTNQLTDELTTGVYDCDKVCRVLYAKGIPVRFLQTDNLAGMTGCTTDKMLLMDTDLAQNPDGSEDVSQALADYLKEDGRAMLSLNAAVPYPHYGAGDVFTAENWNDLSAKFDGKVKSEPVNTLNPNAVWEKVAPFIHSDFAAGKVKTAKGASDETVIRILDSADYRGNYRWDWRHEELPAGNQRWDVQQSLVFANGRVYHFLINMGDEEIENLTVTYGIAKNAEVDWFPQMLCMDGEVICHTNSEAEQPAWLAGRECAVDLKTLIINGLDTYAVIDLGAVAAK